MVSLIPAALLCGDVRAKGDSFSSGEATMAHSGMGDGGGGSSAQQHTWQGDNGSLGCSWYSSKVGTRPRQGLLACRR
jgi:hypothetical protein